MDNYKTLEKIFKKVCDINRAKSVLHWDMATVMPAGGAGARGEQLATLESISHAILNDKGVEELFGAAEKALKKLNPWQKSNFYEMRRVWRHANAVPQRLLNDLTIEGSKCEMVWRKARAENDFKALEPHLKKVVSIVREIAKAKGEKLGCKPYDALLDQYDPGRKSEQVDKIFEDLSGFLPEFTKQVIEKQKSGDQPKPLKGKFPKDKQRELGIKFMTDLGFDFERGRLDESLHPFCGGYPSDIRITTRYDEDDFNSSLMGVLHETGHALYEANLPRGWQGQPVGDARGMSVHESQSLLIEMQVCRSKAFLTYALPVIKKEFGIRSKDWNIENVYANYNKVTPSLIRVDADEVTYPSHIIIRYHIEKYLIDGEMEVEDLPEAWAQGMDKFLGIKPDSDKNGCMQDIHWMDGTFGYFPTYTIGAIYAAQLFKAAKKSDEKMLSSIEKGDFKSLNEWTRRNIHEFGSKFSTDDLLSKATGSPLDLDGYKEHLKERYLD